MLIINFRIKPLLAYSFTGFQMPECAVISMSERSAVSVWVKNAPDKAAAAAAEIMRFLA
jgi:hypothetical protein